MKQHNQYTHDHRMTVTCDECAIKPICRIRPDMMTAIRMVEEKHEKTRIYNLDQMVVWRTEPYTCSWFLTKVEFNRLVKTGQINEPID